LHHKERFIHAFTLLGKFLKQFQVDPPVRDPSLEKLNQKHFETFSSVVDREHVINPWFTRTNVIRALSGIARMLETETLMKWLDAYPDTTISDVKGGLVGVVMAGNIPLVGFHDMMCVMASGHHMLAKTSSKDDRLPKAMLDVLASLDPALVKNVHLTNEQLRGIDVLIATGSNNSARYFEYYFRAIPHIIRKNRNGVAVLTGEESGEDLMGLGDDIFTYFGMGCRNVTKIYIPEDYDLTVLMGHLDRYQDLYQHHKYGNNVDYYRSIYIMNRIPLLDNGVILLKEDTAIASPVGVVFYERYSDIGRVQDQLADRKEEIQCVVSVQPEFSGAIPPGSTQDPMPWDYADGVDTLRFLTELN
jgi:hypothetical protein